MLLTKYQKYEDVIKTLSEGRLFKEGGKGYSGKLIKMTKEFLDSFANSGDLAKYLHVDSIYEISTETDSKPMADVIAVPKKATKKILDGSDITLFLTNINTKEVLKITSKENYTVNFKTLNSKDSASAKKGKVVEVDHIFIKEKTQNIETAQCLGFFINIDKLKINIEKSIGKDAERSHNDIIIDELNKMLKANSERLKDQDFKINTFYKNNQIIKEMSSPSIANMLLLMEGSWRFARDVLHEKFGNDFYITSARIMDYYKAEENNQHVKVTPKSKPNTADITISSIPTEELIKKFSGGEKVGFRSDDGIIYFEEDKSKYWIQISLKKSIDGAQLGKYTDFLKQYLDISDSDNLKASVKPESFISHEEPLSESVIGNIVNYIKKLSKETWDKIKNLISRIHKWSTGLLNKLNSSFDEQQKKDVKELSKLMGLNESVIYDYLNEAKKEPKPKKEPSISPNTFLAQITDEQKKILLDNVNKRLYQLETTFNSINNTSKRVEVLYSLDKIKDIPTNIQTSDIYKLFTNYTTFEIIRKIIGVELVANEKDVDQLIQTSIEINREIFFGKTQLPIWKVYGVSEKKSKKTDKTYEYIGTAGEYEKNIKEKNTKGKKIVFALTSTNQGNKYYSLSPYFLNSIDEDGSFLYAQCRAGSNMGNEKYSFIMEGTALKTEEYMRKNIK